MEGGEEVLVTPGEILGKESDIKAGRGAYVAPHNRTIYASLSGRRIFIHPPPHSPDQRPTVEVVGHKAHGAVPEPGSVVIARVTKVMARAASADIMCVGPKSVREKFTGTIRIKWPPSLTEEVNDVKGSGWYHILSTAYCSDRQQDVRATEIDKVDMHSSFHPGDIVRAVVLSLGDARAYYLTTAKNELGVVSAESIAGGNMVPISWTEMQCPLTGQVEQRKVAKAC